MQRKPGLELSCVLAFVLLSLLHDCVSLQKSLRLVSGYQSVSGVHQRQQQCSICACSGVLQMHHGQHCGLTCADLQWQMIQDSSELVVSVPTPIATFISCVSCVTAALQLHTTTAHASLLTLCAAICRSPPSQ
jgi:hypothetical protein